MALFPSLSWPGLHDCCTQACPHPVCAVVRQSVPLAVVTTASACVLQEATASLLGIGAVVLLESWVVMTGGIPVGSRSLLLD